MPLSTGEAQSMVWLLSSWIVNLCLEWSERVNLNSVLSLISSAALWLIASTDSACKVDLGATEFPWCMMRVRELLPVHSTASRPLRWRQDPLLEYVPRPDSGQCRLDWSRLAVQYGCNSNCLYSIHTIYSRCIGVYWTVLVYLDLYSSLFWSVLDRRLLVLVSILLVFHIEYKRCILDTYCLHSIHTNLFTMYWFGSYWFVFELVLVYIGQATVTSRFSIQTNELQIQTEYISIHREWIGMYWLINTYQYERGKPLMNQVRGWIRP